MLAVTRGASSMRLNLHIAQLEVQQFYKVIPFRRGEVDLEFINKCLQFNVMPQLGARASNRRKLDSGMPDGGIRAGRAVGHLSVSLAASTVRPDRYLRWWLSRGVWERRRRFQ